jgi:hypothetical protein
LWVFSWNAGQTCDVNYVVRPLPWTSGPTIIQKRANPIDFFLPTGCKP